MYSFSIKGLCLTCFLNFEHQFNVLLNCVVSVLLPKASYRNLDNLADCSVEVFKAQANNILLKCQFYSRTFKKQHRKT